MYDDTLAETANRKAIIEAIASVTSGDIVRINDRTSTATVTEVFDWGDSTLNSRVVKIESNTRSETVYELRHDYDDDGLQLRQRRGFDNDGDAIWHNYALEALEVVQSHRFQTGNVYQKGDETSTRYMTVVDRDPVGGRYTTFRNVLVDDDSGDVWTNDETDRVSRFFKEEVLAGEFELVAEIRKNDEVYDTERDEILRVAWIAAESVALMDVDNEVVRRLKFNEYAAELGERLTAVEDSHEDDEDDEWDPEPATLRDGETRDISGHARRDLEQVRIGKEDLEAEREADGSEESDHDDVSWPVQILDFVGGVHLMFPDLQEGDEEVAEEETEIRCDGGREQVDPSELAEDDRVTVECHPLPIVGWQDFPTEVSGNVVAVDHDRSPVYGAHGEVVLEADSVTYTLTYEAGAQSIARDGTQFADVTGVARAPRLMTDGGEDQPMLSKFDAGDTSKVDLSLPEEGFDLEAKREVEAYAEEVTSGGWELINISNDRISWWNPDGHETYWIERKKAGWHGKDGKRDVRPHYTDDLQEALDGAGEFLADNPVERDDAQTDGGQKTDEVPVVAAQRHPRRDEELSVAAQGYGFPTHEPVSEDAHSTFTSALDQVREEVDMDTVGAGDRLGTLVVDPETREVLEVKVERAGGEGPIRADGGQSGLEVLYNADTFECVHLPAIDVTITVVDHLSMFGAAGVVGATTDGEAYLLLEDYAESTPPIRVEKWNGNTYDPVMRASRVENRGEGPDGMFVVPSSASSEAEKIAREAAQRADDRARTDGGPLPARELRRAEVEDGISFAVDGEEVRGRVTAIDDEPDPGVDIFEDPLEVRVTADGESYKLTTYRIMYMGDSVHVHRDESAGHEGTWKRIGSADRVEIEPRVQTDGSGNPEDVLLGVEEGDRLRVEIGGMGVRHLGDVTREAELVVEIADGPEPDDDPLSPFVESVNVRGYRTDSAPDGEIEGWELSMAKRGDGSWMGPRIQGHYYGPDPGADEESLDYRETAPVAVDAIDVVEKGGDES